jgi:hypothetical protein
MSEDAGFELAKAMLDALKAAEAVTAFTDQRIYGRVPARQDDGPPVAYPYISLGPITTIPDDFECIAGEEITVQLDIWTSGGGEAWGPAQCAKLCGAVKRTLHDAVLNLNANALVSLRHELTRILDDPQSNICHGPVQFTAQVELAAA